MKKRKILVVVIVVFSIMLTSATFYIYQIFKTPNVLVDKADKYLLIPTGADFKEVQNILHDEGYTEDLVSFSFLAKLMDYDEGVKPGRYLLKPDMSNYEAIKLLRSGLQTPINITFNNIRLKKELAEKITRNIEADEGKFLALINDSTVVNELGFNKHTILTMFIPNTYEVYWTITEKELLDRMSREYKNFWNEERLKKAARLNMTPVEVSILASIVNAETKKKDESAKIAGVYINRLQRNMALQADPTLVYATGDFSIKRVLNVHKELDSPYNTYMYPGLPPGPINLPPIHSIDAVLNYEDHKYLYFCAREDFSGYHRFATNLTQHLKNARVYQSALNKANLYR